ncbi:MAG: prepilin-type N-terminal cleavage/methylation domain-containing protein [Candidatus Omnitrophica bacterium]|nr:prepilin-type N-terminal cleavage/methylation domain-containing protein [Candidatus Omnitrophota bacterium]
MKKNRGITLIEIMVVSLIGVFMLLTLTAVFASSKGAWAISQVKSDLYADARKAMDRMRKELMEGSSGGTETFAFIDLATGEYTQGVWMASARGNLTQPGEDGSLNNNYMHLDANNVISWRSVIVYCPYQTTDGLKQLRRYADFGPAITYYAQPNVFPLTFISATLTYLNFQQVDGTTLNIPRAQGEVLANYMGNEDANNNNSLDAIENDGDLNLPADNEDGVLNLGFNAIKSVGSMNIALFFTKKVSSMQQAGRILKMTLRNSVKFRQP